MASMKDEQINLELRAHQGRIDDWPKKDLAENLHIWAERFIREFKLKSAVPALTLDRLRPTRYGHFRPGRNGFGLLNEIAINETYVNKHEYWRVLVTLLHELLHAEQEAVGTPGRGNYHNKEFRERAEALGLIVDHWGHTWVAPRPTFFWSALEKYGLKVLDIVEPAKVTTSKAGNSKLKLWVCQCPKPVRVRVAISDFRARCLKCGQLFVKAE